MKIAFMIWLSGCLLFVSYHIMGYLMYKKSVSRWGIPVNNKNISDALDKVKSELEIKGPIRIMVSKQVEVPMLVGMFKPVIWLHHQQYDQR